MTIFGIYISNSWLLTLGIIALFVGRWIAEVKSYRVKEVSISWLVFWVFFSTSVVSCFFVVGAAALFSAVSGMQILFSGAHGLTESLITGALNGFEWSLGKVRENFLKLFFVFSIYSFCTTVDLNINGIGRALEESKGESWLP